MEFDRRVAAPAHIVDPGTMAALRAMVPGRGRPRWVPGPIAGDILVALAIAVGTALIDVLGAVDRVGSAPVWDIALAVPLVLRRRRPAHAFALISLVCLAQWLADVEVSGDVALLLALFSVAAYGRRWPTLIAAIMIAELGVVLAFLKWGPAHHWLLPALTGAGTVSACWIVGIYMRMRRDYVATIQARAETAERERDSQARVAVAAERARIAREMHDVIAHSLSVMITLKRSSRSTGSSRRPSPMCSSTPTKLALGAEEDIEVVGEADDGNAAVRLAASLRPDVVLMDVRMPGGGIEATRRIVAADPRIRIIILTTFDLDEYAFEGLRAGASGFLLKNARPRELISGIRSVAAGDAVLAPTTTRRLLDTYASGFAGPAAPPRPKQDVLEALTQREREVFDELAAGRTNKEIAGRLFLSETTVKTHVVRILSKLDLRDRVQAVILAYESGIAPSGS